MNNNTQQIDLTPSKELAFLTAITLGDGYIRHSKKTNNYRIGMETTSKKQLEVFKKYINKVLPNNKINIYSRNKIRKFNNIEKIYSNTSYIILISSKMFFNFIKQYKKDESYLNLPEWIKEDKEFIYGFLDGFIYAEGSFHKDNKYKLGISRIHIIQKRKENLIQLGNILKEINIEYTILKRPDSFVLNINRKKHILDILNNCKNCYLDKYIIKEVKITEVKNDREYRKRN
jgi:hypothetical protein